jgi:hypothetical protein
VVHDAECQPVALGVRSAGLMPANVGGVQGDRHAFAPSVVRTVT